MEHLIVRCPVCDIQATGSQSFCEEWQLDHTKKFGHRTIVVDHKEGSFIINEEDRKGTSN